MAVMELKKMKHSELVKLSKLMSHALRHEPKLYGFELDEFGWVDLDIFIEGLRKHSSWLSALSLSDIKAAIASGNKVRHEIKHNRIRAFYGHSIADKLNHERVKPPVILFHGTNAGALAKIKEEGVQPMSRQYVHLSVDKETAAKVARRRTDSPIILEVEAEEAFASGINFYLGNEDIWLSEAIPVCFLKGW